jgi:hypothetical protein
MLLESCRKRIALRRLARKRCKLQFGGYYQPEDFPEGERKYCFQKFVSPYTKGAGNMLSPIMIVLQDWSSADKLREQGYNEDVARLGRDPKLLTNERLELLLKKIFRRELCDFYATNAFPLIKEGRISAPISDPIVRRLAKEFLYREIEIVRPKSILALGLKASRALGAAEIVGSLHLEIVKLPHPAARVGTPAHCAKWKEKLKGSKAMLLDW